MGKLKSLAATVLACAVSLANSGPRDDEVASVTVSRATRPEGVVYSYALTNRGILPIIGLKIGYDFYRGEVQLSGSRPTLLAPPSWAGTVISLEESDRFEIDWEVESRDAAIGPGQTGALFRAILPAENSASSATGPWRWQRLLRMLPDVCNSFKGQGRDQQIRSLRRCLQGSAWCVTLLCSKHLHEFVW